MHAMYAIFDLPLWSEEKSTHLYLSASQPKWLIIRMPFMALPCSRTMIGRASPL